MEPMQTAAASPAILLRRWPQRLFEVIGGFEILQYSTGVKFT